MKPAVKFFMALVFLMASFLLLRDDGWFGFGVLIALPLVILYGFDLGRELRTPESGRLRLSAGMLIGVLQALFGILCFLTGGAIIVWVLYNSFWQRAPSYRGGFLSFGIGPLMAITGLALVSDAFRKRAQRDE